MIGNKELEIVTEIIHLGQMFHLENKIEKEIKRRSTPSWKKSWSLKNIFKGNFKNHHIGENFNICVAFSPYIRWIYLGLYF